MAISWKWPDTDTVLLLVIGGLLTGWGFLLPGELGLVIGGIGLVLLVGGVLLWREHALGHWIAGIAFLLVGLLSLYRIITKGIAVRPVLAVTFCAWGVWEHFYGWRTRAGQHAEDEEEEADSDSPTLVLLLPRPRDPELFNEAYLRKVMERTFQVKMHDNPDATEFVAGAWPLFMVTMGDWFIHVLHQDEAFFDDPEATAADFTEQRVARAVQAHRAYLALSVIHMPEDADERAAYRQLGRLALALLDQERQAGFPQEGTTALAIVCPSEQQVRVLDEEVRARLGGDDPLSLFQDLHLEHPPVLLAEEDDPRLHAATAEARRRWPEFLRAFGARRPDATFAVKTALREGETVEHLWLKVDRIENDTIWGTLDNEPLHLQRHRHRDRVQVDQAEVSDWLYTQGDEIHGGFSVQALDEIHQDKTS